MTTLLARAEEASDATSRENPLSFSWAKTVPQTDTGGREENSKALERTRVKELGKIAP